MWRNGEWKPTPVAGELKAKEVDVAVETIVEFIEKNGDGVRGRPARRVREVVEEKIIDMDERLIEGYLPSGGHDRDEDRCNELLNKGKRLQGIRKRVAGLEQTDKVAIATGRNGT